MRKVKYYVVTERRFVEANDMMHARFLYGRQEHATIVLSDLLNGTKKILMNK